ncbi:hypothetical protein KIPB_007268, partial [Kipferlia bialata]
RPLIRRVPLPANIGSDAVGLDFGTAPPNGVRTHAHELWALLCNSEGSCLFLPLHPLLTRFDEGPRGVLSSPTHVGMGGLAHMAMGDAPVSDRDDVMSTVSAESHHSHSSHRPPRSVISTHSTIVGESEAASPRAGKRRVAVSTGTSTATPVIVAGLGEYHFAREARRRERLRGRLSRKKKREESTARPLCTAVATWSASPTDLYLCLGFDDGTVLVVAPGEALSGSTDDEAKVVVWSTCLPWGVGEGEGEREGRGDQETEGVSGLYLLSHSDGSVSLVVKTVSSLYKVPLACDACMDRLVDRDKGNQSLNLSLFSSSPDEDVDAEPEASPHTRRHSRTGSIMSDNSSHRGKERDRECSSHCVLAHSSHSLPTTLLSRQVEVARLPLKHTQGDDPSGLSETAVRQRELERERERDRERNARSPSYSQNSLSIREYHHISVADNSDAVRPDQDPLLLCVHKMRFLSGGKRDLGMPQYYPANSSPPPPPVCLTPCHFVSFSGLHTNKALVTKETAIPSGILKILRVNDSLALGLSYERDRAAGVARKGGRFRGKKGTGGGASQGELQIHISLLALGTEARHVSSVACPGATNAELVPVETGLTPGGEGDREGEAEGEGKGKVSKALPAFVVAGSMVYMVELAQKPVELFQQSVYRALSPMDRESGTDAEVGFGHMYGDRDREREREREREAGAAGDDALGGKSPTAQAEARLQMAIELGDLLTVDTQKELHSLGDSLLAAGRVQQALVLYPHSDASVQKQVSILVAHNRVPSAVSLLQRYLATYVNKPMAPLSPHSAVSMSPAGELVTSTVSGAEREDRGTALFSVLSTLQKRSSAMSVSELRGRERESREYSHLMFLLLLQDALSSGHIDSVDADPGDMAHFAGAGLLDTRLSQFLVSAALSCSTATSFAEVGGYARPHRMGQERHDPTRAGRDGQLDFFKICIILAMVGYRSLAFEVACKVSDEFLAGIVPYLRIYHAVPLTRVEMAKLAHHGVYLSLSPSESGAMRHDVSSPETLVMSILTPPRTTPRSLPVGLVLQCQRLRAILSLLPPPLLRRVAHALEGEREAEGVRDSMVGGLGPDVPSAKANMSQHVTAKGRATAVQLRKSLSGLYRAASSAVASERAYERASDRAKATLSDALIRPHIYGHAESIDDLFELYMSAQLLWVCTAPEATRQHLDDAIATTRAYLTPARDRGSRPSLSEVDTEDGEGAGEEGDTADKAGYVLQSRLLWLVQDCALPQVAAVLCRDASLLSEASTLFCRAGIASETRFALSCEEVVQEVTVCMRLAMSDASGTMASVKARRGRERKPMQTMPLSLSPTVDRPAWLDRADPEADAPTVETSPACLCICRHLFSYLVSNGVVGDRLVSLVIAPHADLYIPYIAALLFGNDAALVEALQLPAEVVYDATRLYM